MNQTTHATRRSLLAALVPVLALLLATPAAPVVAQENIRAPQADFNITYSKQRRPAPAFTLMDLDGTAITLAGHAGKVVLINFWATWCGPCVKEMPALQGLWETYRDDGLVVIAINVDRGRSKAVRKFVQGHDLTLPVALDPKGRVRRDYEVIALPTSYLVGRDGRFVGKVLGDRPWNGAAAHRLIEATLGKRP